MPKMPKPTPAEDKARRVQKATHSEVEASQRTKKIDSTSSYSVAGGFPGKPVKTPEVAIYGRMVSAAARAWNGTRTNTGQNMTHPGDENPNLPSPRKGPKT